MRVRVLVPGPNIDKPPVRVAGRVSYDELLDGGVEVYEYQPTMLHAKTMVRRRRSGPRVGSVNFDNRSFQLHDEATLCVRSERFAGGLTEQFERDLEGPSASSRERWSAAGRSSARASRRSSWRAGSSRGRGRGPGRRSSFLGYPGQSCGSSWPACYPGRDRVTRAAPRASAIRSRVVQHLGDLDRVGGRALEQVVGDHPQAEAALVRRVAADPADEDLVAAGGAERRRVRVRRPGRRPASGRAAARAARARPRPTAARASGASRTPSGELRTGTRAHVTLMAIDSSPRILRVSNIILRSSSVWSSPSAKLPAPPRTLNAIGCG